MPQIYKSPEGERLVRERYLRFLQRWPTANKQLRVPTREGETFVVASGDPAAPPVVQRGQTMPILEFLQRGRMIQGVTGFARDDSSRGDRM